MPLVTERCHVLDIYAEAAERRWVVPCFCSENLTTTEAVLAAAKAYGQQIGRENLPITLALTNQYAHRTQSAFYTHTRQWDVGLRLFLADIGVLTAASSPFAKLNVLVHLDHIQHDLDHELLTWDLRQFSSIMFDASSLPFEENAAATRRFVEEHGKQIVIEGACDEIVGAGGQAQNSLTTPDKAEQYLRQTQADFIVANLGTEHRASAAEMRYQGHLARQIKARIGTKVVLHGCSSVPPAQVCDLFQDGVCKVNLWTALERDSSPVLLADMVRNAAKVAGPEAARELADQGLLGPRADQASRAALSHFTTCYRQQLVFEEMQRIVLKYLALWYH